MPQDDAAKSRKSGLLDQTPFRIPASFLRAIGLAMGAAIPWRWLRLTVIALLFAAILFLSVHPLPVTHAYGPLGDYLIPFGFLLCAAYIVTWITEENRRRDINIDTLEGQKAARGILDLRATAVLAGTALCLLIPIAFWHFTVLGEQFSVHPDNSPIVKEVCLTTSLCDPESEGILSWIVYCVQLYLTAIPVFDATDVYGLNFSGVSPAGTNAMHLALIMRLAFDTVLLTIIFGGLKDTQQNIGIAMARLEDTPTPAAQIGQPMIAPLEHYLTEIRMHGENNKKAKNAIIALGKIKRTESADALLRYLFQDRTTLPNANIRKRVATALSSISDYAQPQIRRFMRNELDKATANTTRPLEAILGSYEPHASAPDLEILKDLLTQPRSLKIANLTLDAIENLRLTEAQARDLIPALRTVHQRLSGTKPRDISALQSRAAKIGNRIEKRKASGWLLFGLTARSPSAT